MNQTRNPVVTVSEHHKPLDHPGVYITLKLINYIHCQVTPRQTSATPLPTVTDYHTLSHINDHHQRGQCRGSKWAPGSFFFSFFLLLMMDFSKHDEPRLPHHLPQHQHICTHHGRVQDEPGSKRSRMWGSSLESTFFFFFLFWFTY